MALSTIQKLALSCIGRRYIEQHVFTPVTLLAITAYIDDHYGGRKARTQNVRQSLARLEQQSLLTVHTLNETPPVHTYQLTEMGMLKAQEIILEEDSAASHGPDLFWS
ncbi:helix-turn-helix transcriptional regulator [Citrobacter freundii]|uniref:helix-turn-helix transcriptional regulator n=1 Tax=Citrobacter freundii TaxID=546 RepID=UPI0015EAB700|nr:helix-turn-helix transcriptional regulator [Citrobacter freundii]EGT5658424.1 hypothetical protein [Citrobacter braakii]EKQ7213285.1 helix-turn-helix transcriptional regulator [Citrobacter freundii]ELK1250020.1 helix-turn-helix transcriptional regulator [Citrobacter freundii]ELK6451457.1 helix-turn-helix transcriptional regulator [Citrobacter freundii]ELR9593970.1 helix-turn-helix transcriptional regulator [Citrobacter freundii]